MKTDGDENKRRGWGNGGCWQAVKMTCDWCRALVLTPPRLGAETGTWTLCNPGPSKDGERTEGETDWAVCRRQQQQTVVQIITKSQYVESHHKSVSDHSWCVCGATRAQSSFTNLQGIASQFMMLESKRIFFLMNLWVFSYVNLWL